MYKRQSYGNTILYTVLGTTISLSITAMGAYALSAKRMIGHKFFSMMKMCIRDRACKLL